MSRAVIAGDDQDAKAQVTHLLDQFGFDTVDAGPLREGWRIQRDTPGYGPRRTAEELCRGLAAAKRYADRWRDEGHGTRLRRTTPKRNRLRKRRYLIYFKSGRNYGEGQESNSNSLGEIEGLGQNENAKNLASCFAQSTEQMSMGSLFVSCLRVLEASLAIGPPAPAWATASRDQQSVPRRRESTSSL